MTQDSGNDAIENQPEQSNSDKSVPIPAQQQQPPPQQQQPEAMPQAQARPPFPASPVSPRLTASPYNSRNTRLRSRSVDHPLMGPPLSPRPVNLPRSVPVSPVTGKPFSSAAGGPNEKAPFFLGAAAAMPIPPPPERSERQKAMESAVAAERMRAKELEPKELEMSADQLRAVLKTERRRTAKIAADLAAFKHSAVELQSEAEVIEEGRINGLMRRLDNLQQEKGKIIFELEREEEMLTNTLQKQLNEVRREKAILQQQIDREKKSNSTLETHLSDLKESNLGMGQAPEATLETRLSDLKESNLAMGQVPEEEDEDDEENEDGVQVNLPDLFEALEAKKDESVVDPTSNQG